MKDQQYHLIKPEIYSSPIIIVNFVYASLLRNLVFHCKFPLVEPPPWKLCRNTRYPYRSVGRRREGPSRVICHQVSSGQRAYNSVELNQLLVLMGAACWIAVSAVSAWKVPRTVLHVWSIFKESETFSFCKNEWEGFGIKNGHI